MKIKKKQQMNNKGCEGVSHETLERSKMLIWIGRPVFRSVSDLISV